MKIECTQNNLQKGLAFVSRSVGTRTTMPVLANVLLKTEGGRLRLSATDLEIGVSVFVGSKVDKEGAVTLPARLLSEFVANNNDEKIVINVDGEQASVSSAHYSAKIKGINASEFPNIPEISPDFEVEVGALDFRDAINQTVFAASIDDTRPILSGVLIKAEENNLKMVATDSFRLAEKTISLEKKVTRKTQVVVPARTMVELVRLLEGSEEKVRLRVGENQVAFIIGDIYLVSRVIEGAFPDYEQIIPAEVPVHSKVKRRELVDAMKVSTLFARDNANNVKIKVSSMQIEILATSPQLGENTSRVDAKTTGDELEIAFNAKYILDTLMVMKGEEVDMGFVGKINPCVFKSPHDKTFLCIIMPLRVET
ncbi:MAG TPA: DNA polymerase III subunit beta [bacterium]|jgi:DNA polymerase-3 subunit beta|nr:DNA polymerase III subunit beta [bacterium]